MRVVTLAKIHNFAFLLPATTYELKQDLPGITLLFVTSDELKRDLGLFLLKIADSPG